MRILMLPRYTVRGASSRYRFWQYVPGLRSAGHEVDIKPLMSDGYLTELYGTGRRGWQWLARGYAARFLDALRAGRYDAVLCEHEVFPFLPASAEMIFSKRNARFILDYDDAPHCKYERWPMLRKKIGRLMAAAETVVVGNDELASYARKFTPHVTVIPTVVNLAAYPNHQSAVPSSKIRIAWIGTPMTANYLKPLIPELERLQKNHRQVVFRFIGAGSFAPKGLRIESWEWSAATEGQLLSECDIGIMPLSDTEFTRGKCGLKLIQYMACGLPVVASPVGVNQKIVEENRNGFLAADAGEWFEKLEALVENADLRKRLGEAGRRKVAAQYTVEHGLVKWLEILEKGSRRDEEQPQQIEETVSAHG
jgi:glycosyltransferase involved in cell wall biosynthesis